MRRYLLEYAANPKEVLVIAQVYVVPYATGREPQRKNVPRQLEAIMNTLRRYDEFNRARRLSTSIVAQ